MAFPAATYNLTLLGSSSIGHPYVLRNLPDFVQFPNATRVQFSDSLIPSILNATEDRHFQAMLDPVQARLRQISAAHSNVLSQANSRAHRKQSFIIKRSHNSRKGQRRQARTSTSTTKPTTSTLRSTDSSAKSSTLPGAEHQKELLDTDNNRVLNTGNSGILSSQTSASRRLTTPSDSTTLGRDDRTTVNDRTTLHDVPIQLVDNRSPEHADLFESTRVKRPLTSTQRPLSTARKPLTTTQRPPTTTQGPIATKGTTAAPILVTPRMALPSPSPDTFMKLPVSISTYICDINFLLLLCMNEYSIVCSVNAY